MIYARCNEAKVDPAERWRYGHKSCWYCRTNRSWFGTSIIQMFHTSASQGLQVTNCFNIIGTRNTHVQDEVQHTTPNREGVVPPNLKTTSTTLRALSPIPSAQHSSFVSTRPSIQRMWKGHARMPHKGIGQVLGLVKRADRSMLPSETNRSYFWKLEAHTTLCARELQCSTPMRYACTTNMQKRKE